MPNKHEIDWSAWPDHPAYIGARKRLNYLKQDISDELGVFYPPQLESLDELFELAERFYVAYYNLVAERTRNYVQEELTRQEIAALQARIQQLEEAANGS